MGVVLGKQGKDLRFAASTGNPKRLSELIHAGADVNETDSSGNTALIEAVQKGHIECVTLLLTIKS